MSRQFELEEESLEDQLANGEISQKEFNQVLRDMQISFQAEAEEAAREAYDNEMDRW